MSLYFPVPQYNRAYSFKEGMRQFGWRRGGGKRLHAGCDLYAPVGSPVRAITEGTVTEFGEFYSGTYQVSISYPLIGVVRYGEIAAFEEGRFHFGLQIKAGEEIGKIGKLVGMKVHLMLHFEHFKGTEAGDLTKRGNITKYFFVPIGPYHRREDLVNPTELLEKLLHQGTV